MKKITLYLNDKVDVDDTIFFLQANIDGLITVSVEDEEGARMLIPDRAFNVQGEDDGK